MIQISVPSEMAYASSTSIPRYLAVFSLLLCPSKDLHGAQIAGRSVDYRRLAKHHAA
jgi:hypothetical protein